MTLRLRIAKMEAAMNIGDEQARFLAKLAAMTYEELQDTILELYRRILADEASPPADRVEAQQGVAEIEAERRALTGLLPDSRAHACARYSPKTSPKEDTLHSATNIPTKARNGPTPGCREPPHRPRRISTTACS